MFKNILCLSLSVVLLFISYQLSAQENACPVRDAEADQAFAAWQAAFFTWGEAANAMDMLEALRQATGKAATLFYAAEEEAILYLFDRLTGGVGGSATRLSRSALNAMQLKIVCKGGASRALEATCGALLELAGPDDTTADVAARISDTINGMQAYRQLEAMIADGTFAAVLQSYREATDNLDARNTDLQHATNALNACLEGLEPDLSSSVILPTATPTSLGEINLTQPVRMSLPPRIGFYIPAGWVTTADTWKPQNEPGAYEQILISRDYIEAVETDPFLGERGITPALQPGQVRMRVFACPYECLNSLPVVNQTLRSDTTIELSGRRVAYMVQEVRYTHPRFGSYSLEQLALVIPLGEDIYVALTADYPVGERPVVEPIVLAIADTLSLGLDESTVASNSELLIRRVTLPRLQGVVSLHLDIPEGWVAEVGEASPTYMGIASVDATIHNSQALANRSAQLPVRPGLFNPVPMGPGELQLFVNLMALARDSGDAARDPLGMLEAMWGDVPEGVSEPVSTTIQQMPAATVSLREPGETGNEVFAEFIVVYLGSSSDSDFYIFALVAHSQADEKPDAIVSAILNSVVVEGTLEQVAPLMVEPYSETSIEEAPSIPLDHHFTTSLAFGFDHPDGWSISESERSVEMVNNPDHNFIIESGGITVKLSLLHPAEIAGIEERAGQSADEALVMNYLNEGLNWLYKSQPAAAQIGGIFPAMRLEGEYEFFGKEYKAMLLVVNLTNDLLVVVEGTTLKSDYEALEPIVNSIVQTLRPEDSAAETAPAQASATTEGDLMTFKSADKSYSFDYPEPWVMEETFTPDGTPMVFVLFSISEAQSVPNGPAPGYVRIDITELAVGQTTSTASPAMTLLQTRMQRATGQQYIGEPIEIMVAGRPAAQVRSTAPRWPAGENEVIDYIIDLGNDVFLAVSIVTDQGDMARFEDTAMAIVNSLRLAE